MGNKYVVFDLEYLSECYHTIWLNYGNIITMAFYTFLIVASVFVVFNIVESIGR